MAEMDREGGAFFGNNRKSSQNAPDYRGELRISSETLDALIAQRQQGVQFPKMEISGWKKVSNSGTTFISMQGKKPYVKDGGGRQGGGGYQQGGSRPQGWTPPANNAMDDEIPF